MISANILSRPKRKNDSSTETNKNVDNQSPITNCQSLNPDGYLFLGASESLISYSQDFERLEVNGGAYYQIKRSVL